jgi:putative ABC transport system permease protein
MAMFIRGGGDPGDLIGPVRGAIREHAPGVPIGRVRTMDEITTLALARERFTLALLGTFAILAVLLAAIGVYGLISQGVAARTREIGLRMAVGAGSGRVARDVLREAMVLATTGVLVGLAGGIALSWSIRRLLYEVSPLDPRAVLGTASVLAVTVALATVLPARRAARLDPLVALRDG